MASSSRLVGRLWKSPASLVKRSQYVVTSQSIRAARYATSAVTAKSSELAVEEVNPPAIPDPAVIKKSRKTKSTSGRAVADKLQDPRSPASQKRRRTKAEIAAMRGTSGYPPDPSSPFPHLPKEEDWKVALGISTHWDLLFRQFVANPATIEKIIENLDLKGKREAAGRKLTILEGYPGPGTLTRRLLQDENVEKVVAMESHPGFKAWLQTLTTDTTLGEDAKKLHILDNDCYNWETYTEMIESGALDHLDIVKDVRHTKSDGPLQFGEDWKAASPILFIGQFSTTVSAEQLLAQFVAAIARRYWLFRYTRMPMFFVCSEHVAWRCIAQPAQRLRSRMSVLTQALADSKIMLDADHFSPHEEHFWPYKHSAGSRLPRTQNMEIKGGVVTGTLVEYGHCLLSIEPRARALIQGPEVDAFEYVLRNLFVKKATSVKSNLAQLAPGAVNLLEAIKKGHPTLKELGPIDIGPNTVVNNLTNLDLIALAKMFERWPFKPRSYFENIRATPQELAEQQESFGEADKEADP